MSDDRMVVEPSGTVDDPLTTSEQEELAVHEAAIAAGHDVFLHVGAALMAIRDRRLYRAMHGTFEHYVRDRWGYSRPRAYQLIDAATVAENLSAVVSTTGRHGLTERQARVLAQLPAAEQTLVFRLAKEMAPDGTVTNRVLTSLATVAKEVIAVNAIDDGTGEHVAWDELPPEKKAALFKAAVTEETYERHERQQNKLRRLANTSAEWFTPSRIVESVREVFGGEIDVDPASCDQANQTVKAKTYYSIDGDGLQHSWPGRVFLNPPHGKLAGDFVNRLLVQYEVGTTTAAILLLNAHAFDNAWFQPLWDYVLCFAAERVHFDRPDGGASAAPHGSVFVYVGPDVTRFVRVFRQFGPVMRRCDR
jgi:hypothetical protein